MKKEQEEKRMKNFFDNNSYIEITPNMKKIIAKNAQKKREEKERKIVSKKCRRSYIKD